LFESEVRNYSTIGIRFNKREFEAIDKLAKEKRFKRAMLIREAVHEYIEKHGDT